MGQRQSGADAAAACVVWVGGCCWCDTSYLPVAALPLHPALVVAQLNPLVCDRAVPRLCCVRVGGGGGDGGRGAQELFLELFLFVLCLWGGGPLAWGRCCGRQ